MDTNSIIGRVLGGFAIKAAVIVGAIYGAHSVYVFLSSVFKGLPL